MSFGWDLKYRFVPQDWQYIFNLWLPGRKEGLFVCETVWFFSWANTHPFDLKFVVFCPKFSGDSYVEIRKKLFRANFSEIFCKTSLSSVKTWEISPYFLQFLFWVRIALKKLTQILSYVVCTKVRRHVHKRIKKRRYGEENPWRFVFGKPVVFTLGLGHSTPYFLGVLVWNFYQMFVTVSIEFWLIFEADIRSTRLAINFLLIIARVERNVRLCRETT